MHLPIDYAEAVTTIAGIRLEVRLRDISRTCYTATAVKFLALAICFVNSDKGVCVPFSPASTRRSGTITELQAPNICSNLQTSVPKVGHLHKHIALRTRQNSVRSVSILCSVSVRKLAECHLTVCCVLAEITMRSSAYLLNYARIDCTANHRCRVSNCLVDDNEVVGDCVIQSVNASCRLRRLDSHLRRGKVIANSAELNCIFLIESEAGCNWRSVPSVVRSVNLHDCTVQTAPVVR